MYISTHQLTEQHWEHSVQARPTGGDEAFTSAGKKLNTITWCIELVTQCQLLLSEPTRDTRMHPEHTVHEIWYSPAVLATMSSGHCMHGPHALTGREGPRVGYIVQWSISHKLVAMKVVRPVTSTPGISASENTISHTCTTHKHLRIKHANYGQTICRGKSAW